MNEVDRPRPLRRALRWSAIAIAVSALLLTTLIVLGARELKIHDPETTVANRHGTLVRAEIVDEQEDGIYVVRDVMLTSSSGLVAKLKVKRPLVSTPDLRPLLVVLGGFDTGRDAVDLVTDTRGCVVAALSYTTDKRRLKALGIVDALPVLRDTVPDSVAAVLLALDWLIALPGVDPERVELVGVSLGGPFAVMTGALDTRFTRVWSIHSGGRIDVLLQMAIAKNDLGAPVAFVLSRMVGWAWSSIAPELYVGRISPRPFVLVNGRDDDTVPEICIKSLFDNAKEPKQQEWLSGQHVRPSRQEILDQMMDLVAEYVERGTQ